MSRSRGSLREERPTASPTIETRTSNSGRRAVAARLHRHGPDSLTDEELVALILQAGPSAGLGAAESILSDCGGISGLTSAQPASVVREGVGSCRSAALLAAVELSRRLARGQVPERRPLKRPAAVAAYVVQRYHSPDQEVMGALYLDVRHRLILDKELYRGALNRAAVEPRLILKEGLLHGAAAVVLWHTHPSGDPTPSLEDLSFTRRVAEAGRAVGIQLVDHLVLGATGSWVSLGDRGVC